MIYKDSKEIKKEVKKLCVSEEITLSEVARRLDILPQQLNNKLNNKDIGFNNLSRILQAIGYKLELNFVKSDHAHSSSEAKKQ